MKINDLFHMDPSLRRYTAPEAMNPLTEEDALEEAQVLDIRFDALAGIAGILFDLRQALQLREANTGVLVAHRVHGLTRAGPGRAETQR
ncbi:hypothetical protein ABH924_004431 [Arthrobacter sp. GAS37]